MDVYAKADAPNRNDVPRRRTATYKDISYQERDTDELNVTVKHTSSRPWLAPVGLGMCACILAIWLWASAMSPLLTAVTTHWQYGQAPITHLDGETHHFVTEVVHGRIIVYDFPFDHPEKAQVFICRSAQNGQVVLLSSYDIDHDGHNDVVITTQDNPIATVLYARENGFVEEK